MRRSFLRAKIHRATVTGANLHYEGSISIDRKLMEAAALFPLERVEIYNVSNGERFATYVIPGEVGEIGLNGAAARRVAVGDLVIIAAFADLEEHEWISFRPKLVYVNERNEILEVKETLKRFDTTPND